MPETLNRRQDEVRRALERELRALGWTPSTILATLRALEAMDGVWSWGTARMIRDLAQIHQDLKRRYGKPPDRRW